MKRMLALALLFSMPVLAENAHVSTTAEFAIASMQCVETTWHSGGQVAVAYCPEGFNVISGGCRYDRRSPHHGTEDLLDSFIDSTTNSWQCESSVGTRWYFAKALCCQ